jgi:hypothetical protein
MSDAVKEIGAFLGLIAAILGIAHQWVQLRRAQLELAELRARESRQASAIIKPTQEEVQTFGTRVRRAVPFGGAMSLLIGGIGVLLYWQMARFGSSDRPWDLVAALPWVAFAAAAGIIWTELRRRRRQVLHDARRSPRQGERE